jgi:hypothetical protein
MAANANSLTRTNYLDWLKESYQPDIQAQFKESIAFLRRLRSIEAKTGAGRQWVDFIETALMPSAGPFSETGYMKLPGVQTVDRATFTPKSNNVRAKISGFLMDASKGDVDAMRANDFVMKGMRRRISEVINYQLYGDGSGLLATCASGSSTSVVVQDEAAASGEPGNMRLRVGQQISILDKSDGTVNTQGIDYTTITAISGNTITVADAVGGTLTTAFGIFEAAGNATDTSFSGSTASPYWGTAVSGLAAICSESDPAHGDYGGIDRSTDAFWKGVVKGNSGTKRPISKFILTDALIALKKNGAMPSLMLSSLELLRNYDMLYDSARRTDFKASEDLATPAIREMTGEFANIPWITDKSCPPNKIFMLDESTLYFRVERMLSFMAEDGAAMVRVGSGSTAEDAFELSMVDRRELCCNAPFRNCVIDDIESTEP